MLIRPQIYYTSRTHSQLTQFVGELRRPAFPPSLPDTIRVKEKENSNEGIKHLPLSSRQRLCINPSVSRLGSLAAINDRCAELQQPKSTSKCAFVPSADNLKNTHQFRDNVLATLPDIEDMFALGKKFQVCPYYASRTAIPSAEVITLPYPLLLQQTAREALGIKLEGNVVIIDEAHNIMDAVSNVYAAEIGLGELKRARQMLGVYVKKFGKKLKGENRVMVAQLARVVDGLSAWLDDAAKLKVSFAVHGVSLRTKTRLTGTGRPRHRRSQRPPQDQRRRPDQPIPAHSIRADFQARLQSRRLRRAGRVRRRRTRQVKLNTSAAHARILPHLPEQPQLRRQDLLPQRRARHPVVVSPALPDARLLVDRQQREGSDPRRRHHVPL